MPQNKTQVAHPSTRLDVAAKLDRTVRAVWRPTVGEHVVHAVTSVNRDDEDELGRIPDAAKLANRDHQAEASRRATVRLRRFCVHNGLDRLVTLTFAESTELHERDRVRQMAAMFFRRLRAHTPGLHYVYVLELHPGGHGFHIHAAVNQWIDKATIQRCWGHGWVDVRRLKTKHRGSSTEQRRQCSRYLSKYASKSIDEGRNVGNHRYERSQGGNPPEVAIECDSWQAAEAWLRGHLRRAVVWSWSSLEAGDEWKGPQVLVLWE